jgi:hypothetical protein
MDQIFKTLENSDLSRRSTNGTSLTAYEPVSTAPTDTYQKRMLLLVADSFECSSQNPTTAEKVSRAETWARVLWGVIPEDRLQECFNRAFRAKSDGFPVTAYDLNDAWKQIENEEAEADRKARAKMEEEPIPVKYCANRTGHINKQGDTEGGIPCQTCRPHAYADYIGGTQR